MRVTQTQLRRIIRSSLLGEARGSVGSDDAEMIRRNIEKLVRAYSSITDQDVEALEETGFFKFINRSADYGVDRPEYVYVAYDAIRDIAPLKVAFTVSEMTDAETLETELVGWARRNRTKALNLLPDAPYALNDLISGVRKEHKKFLSKSEAESDDPLGRIAFANSRKGMPYEADTKVEEKLRKAIESHFLGHKLLSPEMADLLRDLMAQGLYSSMFAEPTAAVVYRGMNINSTKGVGWLKKLAGGSLEGKSGTIDVDTNYTPKRGAASWTTSKKVAEGFFTTDALYHITMHARVQDNPGMFLSAVKGLYKTDFAERFADELEAIGLGTIQVFRIDWFAYDESTLL